MKQEKRTKKDWKKTHDYIIILQFVFLKHKLNKINETICMIKTDDLNRKLMLSFIDSAFHLCGLVGWVLFFFAFFGKTRVFANVLCSLRSGVNFIGFIFTLKRNYEYFFFKTKSAKYFAEFIWIRFYELWNKIERRTWN